MKDTLIEFNTAKLAKEKGYINCICDSYYKRELTDMTPYLDNEDDFNRYLKFPERYHAPTQSLLQKWIREEHDIHMLIRPFFDSIGRDTFVCDVIRRSDGRVIKSHQKDTYEEALEEALVNALNLIE